MKKQQKNKLLQVLNFDIHLQKDFKGKRYVERITECRPVDLKMLYFEHRNEKTLEGKMVSFLIMHIRIFFKNNRQEMYTYVNILEYIDGEYVITNKISDENLIAMKNNMDVNDAGKFQRNL